MINTSQKMKFSIKDFFSKCDQIRSFLRIWSHLLKKSLMGTFFFCAVKVKAHHFHATNRFIDDRTTLHDSGVFNDVDKDLYPPELQIKVEHSGTQPTFVNS